MGNCLRKMRVELCKYDPVSPLLQSQCNCILMDENLEAAADHEQAGAILLDQPSLIINGVPDIVTHPLIMSIQRCLRRRSSHGMAQFMDHAKFQDLLHENCNLDVAAFKAPSVPHKTAIVQKLATVGPPPQFRLIDLKFTLAQNRVVLVDGQAHQDTYTAISHTWGAEVYGVFDCECACESSACAAPRFSATKPCPGATAHGPRHGVVVGDILKMCEICLEAGSEFVWHDGVCIAQHNPAEVEETIRHMGWIYANATDTIIFLDYVGNPVALLSPEAPYKTRWNRRVWTLQEATLSTRRRYCIRRLGQHMYPTPDSFLTTPYSSMAEHFWKTVPYFLIRGNTFYSLLVDFEERLSFCHKDDSCIEVIEEGELWTDLLSLFAQVLFLAEYAATFSGSMLVSDCDCVKTMRWIGAVMGWINHMKEELYQIPTFSNYMANCASQRESKHEGDRINSVLGLAGITDFVAPKDGNLEASSIEFLKRVKAVCMQEGIREALFWVNSLWKEEDERKMHTWLPCLSRPFLPASGRDHQEVDVADDNQDDWVNFTPFREQVRCAVIDNGMLELTGYMLCLPVRFFVVDNDDTSELRRFDTARQYPAGWEALSMDLWERSNPYRGGGFDAFAHGSSTKFGNVVMPADMEAQEAIFRPLIQGQVMRKGSSICAFLVFAKFGLDIDASSRYVAPALLVQGPSLLQPVSRLGFFKVSYTFNSFIFKFNQPCFIKLDRLVLK